MISIFGMKDSLRLPSSVSWWYFDMKFTVFFSSMPSSLRLMFQAYRWLCEILKRKFYGQRCEEEYENPVVHEGAFRFTISEFAYILIFVFFLIYFNFVSLYIIFYRVLSSWGNGWDDWGFGLPTPYDLGLRYACPFLIFSFYFTFHYFVFVQYILS